MKGKYIVFEGPEHAGKGTQINLTYDYLIKKKSTSFKM